MDQGRTVDHGRTKNQGPRTKDSQLSQPSLFGPASGETATANIDGGSRGNPGPAGYGVHITRDDGSIVDLKDSIGFATNNIAEYNGLIAALQWAVDHDLKSIAIKGDSQLIIEQMRGNYKVKNEGLKPLYLKARVLVMQIGDVSFEHVRREYNTEADRLSNVGMDGNT